MNQHIETAVLDCEGLSAWIVQDRKAPALFKIFHDMGAHLVTSASTIVEVSHARVDMPRLHRALSRAAVEPVTEQTAEEAAKVLKTAGLDGHRYAIDATVAEAALRQEGLSGRGDQLHGHIRVGVGPGPAEPLPHVVAVEPGTVRGVLGQ